MFPIPETLRSSWGIYVGYGRRIKLRRLSYSARHQSMLGRFTTADKLWRVSYIGHRGPSRKRRVRTKPAVGVVKTALLVQYAVSLMENRALR